MKLMCSPREYDMRLQTYLAQVKPPWLGPLTRAILREMHHSQRQVIAWVWGSQLFPYLLVPTCVEIQRGQVLMMVYNVVAHE